MFIDIPTILPLISAILVFSLGIFVFSKSRKSPVNVSFGLHSLAITVWLFGTFMMFMSKEVKDVAIFWDRFIYIGVVFIPVLLYHFGIVYCKIKNQRKILVLGYVLSAVFLILSRTEYFVDDLFEYQWGVHAKAKFFHHIFLVYFVSYVVLWFYNAYHYYRKATSPLLKQQTKYVFIAFLSLFTIGPVAYLPAYGIGIYPFAYVSGLVFTVVTAYAIVRYRLMDIKMIVRRSTVFSAVVVVITSVYVAAAFLLSWIFFGGVYTLKSQIVIGLIVAMLISIGFRTVYDWLKNVTDTFLFKGDYNPQELLAEISGILARTLDLEAVIRILKEKVARALRVEKIDVVIFDGREEDGRGQGAISIVKDGFALTASREKAIKKLADHFKKRRESLVLEELEKKKADRLEDDPGIFLADELEQTGAALAVPLLLKEKLIGLFFLKAKKSGDIFTDEDIKILETIAAQAAIAIENARLYGQVQSFSRVLQDRVEAQTRHLKELLEMKSDFLRVVNHQLNTPLSVIGGSLDMVSEKSWPMEKGITMIQNGYQRLSQTVADFWNAYELEGEKMEMDPTKTDIAAIVEQQIAEKQKLKLAQDRKLKLAVKKPRFKIPTVWCDKNKILHAISNLLDNAVNYTREGGITVSYSLAGKEYLKINIKDTGAGLSEEDRGRLFQKFSRGAGASGLYPDGSGLGLYIAKKVVEGNDGEISCASDGEGKGSTFTFTLPLYTNQKSKAAEAKNFGRGNKIEIFI